MPATDSPFVDYHFLDLPDLSTLRRPPSSRELISVPIAPECTEKVVLVALARCLGAYCGANDVLLGWQPVEREGDAQRIIAARINWVNANKYEDVLRNIILRETEDSPSSIRQTLEIQLDDGLQPFLAILTSSLEYDHPLVLSLEKKCGEHATEPMLCIKYSTLRFHATTAEILAKQVCALAARIAQDTSLSPRDLNFLPNELLSIVPLRTDGTSYAHYSAARDIVEFMKRHDSSTVTIEYYPDLHEEDPEVFERSAQFLTYGELDKRSNRFAAYLLARGLELEDRVTLCMPRGIEFHVAMMGVLRAGGCYVPIDPELPEERQKFIIEDSGARFSLTAGNISEHIAASESYSDDDINNTRSDGLAYLLYTSGTTGKPKGCLLTHDGFAQAIHGLSWFANQAGPNKRHWPQAGRYLCVASVAFDVHLAEIFVALSLGMTIICAPRSQLFEDLPHWLNRLHITHVGIVPSLIEATMHAVHESAELAADNEGAGTKGQTMDLAYIASGGEKMSDAILDRWADHPLVTLANFYGPSETTIGCSARLMTSANRKENIGRIFENCSAYIVDENLDLVLRGGLGELLVGGRLVGRGYHNRPDLTEKAFIEFSHGLHHERVYRTGDLVRLMPDDSMEILGRIDTQIKLRGVRIESEGVSSVIRNAAAHFPGFTSKTVPDVSTVLARHPQLKTDQLISFIGLDSSKSIAHRRTTKPRILDDVPPGLMRALKEACTQELASYTRPAHIVPLDFLPLNQNGKTDNKALSALFQSESLEDLARVGAHRNGGIEANGHEPSRSLDEGEAKIADIVSRYTEIQRDQLKPSSNLFQLGFDSLKLVRLASELRSLNNSKSVSVGTIIQHPAIEEIAALLDSVQSIKQEFGHSYVGEFAQRWKLEVEEIYGAEKVETILPTFPIQDGVLYRSADIKTLYVQHVLLQIRDNVDIEKLKSTWAALMSQHEILRTVFHYSSSLVQVVLRPDVCELSWIERKIRADNVQEFRSSFFDKDALDLAWSINENLSATPAFRIACYRFEGQTKALLTLSIHHAIYDGISLPLLLEDVETHYLRENPRLTAPLGQVLDVVYDLDMDEAASFWKKMFDGFDWSKIPRRLASGETANTLSRTFRMSLSEWEKNQAKIKVSLQTVLTAAFGLCLSEQLYGVSDVVFGVIRSGRSFADEKLNEARAPLLTVVPTRVNAEAGTNLLQNVQRDIGAVLAFEHIPLSRVQTWLHPGRGLFEVLFSVSIDEEKSTKLWDPLDSKQPQADYIFAVEAVLDKKTGQIRIDCGYTEPLKQDHVASILQEFESAARSLVEGTIREDRGCQTASVPEQIVEEDSDSEDLSDESVDQVLIEKIRSVVSHLLKIDADKVSPTSSLIALGLDSIKSVVLSRALRKEGIEIRSLDIMRHPTIRYTAARSSHAHRPKETENEEKEAERLLADEREKISSVIDRNALLLDEKDEVQLYPTTVLQAGMLSQTISSGSHLYVHAFPLRLKNTVGLDRLKVAWERTIQYFSILRTSFHFSEMLGTWIQVVHSSHDRTWDEINMSSRKTLLDMSEGYITELDLSSEDKFSKPPVYTRLLRQSEEVSAPSSTLILVLHHALYDGISMSRLLDILWKFYHDEEPAPSSQFIDLMGYFKYQEKYGTEYWTRQLRDFNRPHLPRKTSSTSESESFSMSADIPLSAAQMSKACQYFDVPVQCFGQASFAKVLAKLYNRRDVVFGHVVSGRSVPHAEDVLGPLISTLPYRSRISAGIGNLDFIRSIHRQNMDAQRWQHASLRSIQRNIGLGTLWDAIFLFQPNLDDDSSEQDGLWAFDDSEDEVAKIQYPLNIELHQHGSRLEIKAACQTSFFDIDELQAIVKDFSEAFMEMVDDPFGYVLPHLVSDDERDVLANGDARHTSTRPVSALADARMSSFIDVLSACVDAPPNSIQHDTPLVSLGVDSITAIQISSRAREAGLQLHAADILRCQVPMDIVKILGSKTNAAQKGVRNTHQPSQLTESITRRFGSPKDTLERVLPASAGMEWLIGMWQLSNRERFQHIFAFELPSDVAEDVLKLAWSSLVQKHPILRSTFFSSTGNDVQVVTFKKIPDERLWTSRDVTTEESPIKAIEDIAKARVSNPLSTSLPPCQALFLRLPGSNAFMIHIHHFQYDAWSLRLLISDLKRLYRGDKTDCTGNLASFLENCDSSYFKEEQMRYWKAYLPSPFKPSLLPKLVANDANDANDATERNRLFYIDRKALQGLARLRQRAQELSASLSIVLLACWARVQAKYSAMNSATFGLWHLGRSGIVDDIDYLPIPCMNVLPLHVDDTSISIVEMSSRIQTTLRKRSAIVEQTHLVDVNHWAGGADKRVMMNVFVNVVPAAESEKGSCDGLFNPIDLPYFIPKVQGSEEGPTAEKLVICNLTEDALLIDFVFAGDNIGMSVEYRSDYLDEETSRTLVAEWACLVEETLAS